MLFSTALTSVTLENGSTRNLKFQDEEKIANFSQYPQQTLLQKMFLNWPNLPAANRAQPVNTRKYMCGK